MNHHARISDEHAQFLISVYELCAAAHLGHLHVEVRRCSGKRNSGVPTVDDDQLSDWPPTGPPVMIWIEQEPVALDQITQCTIVSPRC